MGAHAYSSDVAFSPAVKAVQERKGSRRGYAAMEERGGWKTAITPDLEAFIADRNSVYMATASADGQPYIQHRGGPKGFLKVLDEHTIAFADFTGNRQYVSVGNLSENPKAQLFMMDYARKRRIKVWGEARVVEDDTDLLLELTPDGYSAAPEQAIIFTVTAWDVNCPQHIPQRFDAADVARVLAEKDEKIAALEAELERLTAA